VNLAARLEQLAPPGGICISQTVRDQIHDDLGVTYLDAGYRRVKNIGKPVRVVRVLFNSPTPFERLRISFGRFPFHTLGIVATAATVLIMGAAFVFDRPKHREPEKLSLQVGEFKAAEPEDVEAARIGKLFAQRIYLALSPDRHLVKIKESQPAEGLVLRERPLARYVVEGVITRIDGGYQVEARLLDSQTRDSFWGDRFDLKETAVTSVATGALRVAMEFTMKFSKRSRDALE
jgi:adenylate cyclase